MKSPNRLLTACTLGILSHVAVAANAESVTYELTLPDVFESFFLQEGDFGGQTMTPITGIPKFDPSLGTLVDVRVSFSYEFYIDVFLESQGILNPGVPHFAEWSAGQLALGLTFENNTVDPPVFSIFGDIIDTFGVGCFGDPGDGEACSDSNFEQFFGGGSDISMNGQIMLDDFVGAGTYEGFTFEFDVLLSNFDLDNVATAFVDVTGSMSEFDTTFSIEYIYTPGSVDTDADGIPDTLDNCINAFNPSQFDADADDYGNICDADINNDCVVNPIDLGALRTGFFGSDPLLDFNNDGNVNTADLGVMRASFFGTPGPSGLTSVCDAPSAPAPDATLDAGTLRYVGR